MGRSKIVWISTKSSSNYTKSLARQGLRRYMKILPVVILGVFQIISNVIKFNHIKGLSFIVFLEEII